MSTPSISTCVGPMIQGKIRTVKQPTQIRRSG